MDLLCLIDTLNPAWRKGQSVSATAGALYGQFRERVRAHAATLRSQDFSAQLEYLMMRSLDFARNHRENIAAWLGPSSPASRHRAMAFRYSPQPLPVRPVVIRVLGRRAHAEALGWEPVFPPGLETADLPFHPGGALTGGNLARCASLLAERLNRE